MKVNNVLETIGNTPHIRIQRLFGDAHVWIKSERSNPGGSIKDRIALAMIEAAEESGELRPGGTIVEPTSGNTGVGLAMVAAVKGYKLILVMPESMSLERRRLMLAYGASFDLTPREKGMKGSIERALEIVGQTPNSWMPQQFENPANIEVHRRTTAQEILKDFAGERLDYWVTGFGTGGTLKGVARVLAKERPETKIVVCEPDDAPMLSSGIEQQRNPDGSAAAAHPSCRAGSGASPFPWRSPGCPCRTHERHAPEDRRTHGLQ